MLIFAAHVRLSCVRLPGDQKLVDERVRLRSKTSCYVDRGEVNVYGMKSSEYRGHRGKIYVRVDVSLQSLQVSTVPRVWIMHNK